MESIQGLTTKIGLVWVAKQIVRLVQVIYLTALHVEQTKLLELLLIKQVIYASLNVQMAITMALAINVFPASHLVSIAT